MVVARTWSRQEILISSGSANSLVRTHLPTFRIQQTSIHLAPNRLTTLPICLTDACMAGDCTGKRIGGENKLKYCINHLCEAAGCRDAKQSGGKFHYCVKHTCESEHCAGHSPGKGDSGSPGRFCDAHRRCARDGCGRRCHMRDSGETLRFCGDHYCHFAGCDEGRSPNSDGHCHRHACYRPACHGGIVAADARFCADHTCKAQLCLLERFRSAGWCAGHVCAQRDCNGQGSDSADAGGYCEKHLRCVVPGCAETRLTKGERTSEHCETRASVTVPTSPLSASNFLPSRNGIHRLTSSFPPLLDHYGRCHWRHGQTGQCAARVLSGSSFCGEHACSFRGCGNMRGLAGSAYCAAHKCAEPTCPGLCMNPVLVAYSEYDAAAARPRGGRLPGAYCALHACRSPDCANQAARDGLFCPVHKCMSQGCQNEAVVFEAGRAGSHRGGFCDFHDPATSFNPGWGFGGNNVGGRGTWGNLFRGLPALTGGQVVVPPQDGSNQGISQFGDFWN